MYVEIVNSDIQTGKFASPPMTLDRPTVGLHRMMKLPMECEVIPGAQTKRPGNEGIANHTSASGASKLNGGPRRHRP
jgi:hypothetical protein